MEDQFSKTYEEFGFKEELSLIAHRKGGASLWWVNLAGKYMILHLLRNGLNSHRVEVAIFSLLIPTGSLENYKTMRASWILQIHHCEFAKPILCIGNTRHNRVGGSLWHNCFSYYVHKSCYGFALFVRNVSLHSLVCFVSFPLSNTRFTYGKASASSNEMPQLMLHIIATCTIVISPISLSQWYFTQGWHYIQRTNNKDRVDKEEGIWKTWLF